VKLVVIGNSGSGKTWLARALGLPAIHLDALFWEPGGFDRKRPRAEVDALIAQSLAQRTWVVEGVFGELAERYLPDADALVWLDLPWATCEARLLARGSESKAHMDRTQSEAGLAKLLRWAADYAVRTDGRSRSGHAQLFEGFERTRHRVRSEAEAVRLLESGALRANAVPLR
jgi:adenylate kinase family enzyme